MPHSRFIVLQNKTCSVMYAKQLRLCCYYYENAYQRFWFSYDGMFREARHEYRKA